MTRAEAEAFLRNCELYHGETIWQATAADALVAKVRQAVMLEREACAQTARDVADAQGGYDWIAEKIDAAIRARP